MESTEDTVRGVKALMFDFYGTIVDMQGGLIDAITPYLARKNYTANPPSRVVTWWRRTHFENSMIDALLHRDHTSYREIGRQTVHYTLERAGIEHTDEEVLDLVAQIERLKPFPDVVDALAEVKTHGLHLVILSNGDPDMLANGVPYSGTEHLWSRVISVAEANSFKPHADTYRTAAKLIGLPQEEVLFVANHAFDCVGAKAAGMKTAFVDRRKRPFGNTHYAPDLVVDDFVHLAKVITSAARAGLST
ncbi:haloacid dehalogenase type II [Nonomuraea sp. NPDC026600]|uniref:haloacid dehalogenase type II n=1 Tax=Nonomuraea sp. NPDC026600 TaxID=3155363 RepID=UPI0033ED7BF2